MVNPDDIARANPGAGTALDVAAVEAELAEPTGDVCPAAYHFPALYAEGHEILRCAARPPGHPPPHRDPRGLAWDDSVVTRAWPTTSAAAIVKDLLAAIDALMELAPSQPMELVAAETRLAAAYAAAERLPGVAP